MPNIEYRNTPKNMTNEGERQTDMEFVLQLSNHILEPCKTPEGLDIGAFYLREAQKALQENKITRPEAIETLQSVINIYDRNNRNRFN